MQGFVMSVAAHQLHAWLEAGHGCELVRQGGEHEGAPSVLKVCSVT